MISQSVSLQLEASNCRIGQRAMCLGEINTECVYRVSVNTECVYKVSVNTECVYRISVNT